MSEDLKSLLKKVNSLPEELIEEIFINLDINTAHELSKYNRKFNRIAYEVYGKKLNYYKLLDKYKDVIERYNFKLINVDEDDVPEYYEISKGGTVIRFRTFEDTIQEILDDVIPYIYMEKYDDIFYLDYSDFNLKHNKDIITFLNNQNRKIELMSMNIEDFKIIILIIANQMYEGDEKYFPELSGM